MRQSSARLEKVDQRFFGLEKGEAYRGSEKGRAIPWRSMGRLYIYMVNDTVDLACCGINVRKGHTIKMNPMGIEYISLYTPFLRGFYFV